MKTKASLTRHLQSCKRYKDFQVEQKHKEETSTIENQYDNRIKELECLLKRQEEAFQSKINTLNNTIHKQEETHNKAIEQIQKDCEIRISVNRETFTKDYNDLVIENKELKTNLSNTTKNNQDLAKRLELTERELRYDKSKIVEFASQAMAARNVGGNTITNNIAQVQNNIVQLHFDTTLS